MMDKIFDIYFENYKLFLIIPIIVLIVNLYIIYDTYSKTGSFIYMDSSLKGGESFTFTYSDEIDTDDFLSFMSSKLNTTDIDVIVLRNRLSNSILGYEVQTEEGINKTDIQDAVEEYIGIKLNDDDISFGTQSSVIGSSFLKDSINLLVMGFFLMTLVSYFSFRNVIPAISITFSTLSDFIGIIALMDFFKIKVSVVTIGALLMIIGYSTDSDILLATNILKRKDGKLRDRMYRAIGTELTMDLAAVVTFSIMYLLSSVEVIKHIAFILLIGIFFDIMNTWGQNAGLQRLYKEYIEARK